MKFELTEENVLSTVHFIVERCRHHFDRFGYLDDISYYEFRAQLQGIALLLSGHADSLIDRVVEAQEEISSIYKQSTDLALSPAQPAEAVGQGATASCDPDSYCRHSTNKCSFCGGSGGCPDCSDVDFPDFGEFHCSSCRDTGECPNCQD